MRNLTSAKKENCATFHIYIDKGRQPSQLFIPLGCLCARCSNKLAQLAKKQNDSWQRDYFYLPKPMPTFPVSFDMNKQTESL